MKQFFSSYGTHFKRTLQLAWPAVLGQLAQVVLQFTDYIMLGQLEGNTAFSAATIANNIFILILVFGIGLIGSIGPLVAEAHGNKNPGLCGKYLRQGLWVAVFISGVLTLLTLGMAALIPYMNQPAESVQPAQEYLNLLAWSIFPVMIMMVYKQFTEGLSFMKPGMALGVFVVGLNIFLNYLLIFGKWGFPQMGIMGAGWATLISRYAGGIGLIFLVIALKHFRVYRPWPDFKEFDFEVITRIVKVGAPIGFQYLFEVSAFGVSAMIAGSISITGQVAHQIALNLATVSYMVSTGIATAAAIRVGNAKGMGRKAHMRKSGFAAIWIGIIWMALASVVLIIFRKDFPPLFKDDPEVVALATSLIIFAAIFQVSDGVQAVALGALRGLSDVFIPFLITLIAYWVIGIPLGYLLSITFEMGVIGLWIGFAVALSCSALFLSLRFAQKTRVQKNEDPTVSRPSDDN